MVASAFLNSCAIPADNSPTPARFSFSCIRCCSAASSVKSVTRQIAPLIFPSPRRIGEMVTPRCRVSPAGGICFTSSRRKIFPFERHSAISFVNSEDAPSASLYRRKASPRMPRTCSAAGFELEIIPVAFTTSSPQRPPIPRKRPPANPQSLPRRRIGPGNNPRRFSPHQPRRHVPRHFLAQTLRLFRPLFFDAMQPFQFLFLLAQLLNHPLHRRRHERRRILRPRTAARFEFLLLLLPRALKKLPHQKHH